jgi:Kef-type K+ transport system membrane component KefB
VIASVALLLVIGSFAILFAPKIIEWMLIRLPEDMKEHAMLGIMLSCALALILATKYAQSSYILGTFLAGLCFCSSSHASTAWTRQVKSLLPISIRQKKRNFLYQ